MKRSLLVASCVLLVSGLLSSCQKEDKDIVQLANELTAELQRIKDPTSANARAERVEVLNKRFQDASARVFALNGTALERGADSDADHQGAAYAAALKELAREIGRVRASFPGKDSGGDNVDRERLLIAIGAVAGEKTAAERKAYGESYLQDESNTHDTPGNFPEYYGSDKLRAALSYRTNLNTFSNMKFDSAADVPAIPSASSDTDEDVEAAAAKAEAEAAAADDSGADDTPADDTPADDSSDEPSADDDTPSTPADDEEPASDEEPAADEEPSSDDEIDFEGSLDL